MLTTEWFTEMASSFLGTIGFIILMIFAFMFIFIFVGVVTPIFMFYNIFLSYLVIFAFNSFWPPKILSVCSQIFQELKEIPVDTPIDKWGKLKNAILQNFHSLYLLVMVVTIIIMHMNTAMSFANPSITVVVILINILIGYVFAPSSFSVPFVLLKILMEKSESDDPAKPPEGYISD
jgi:hypothetical protein